MKRGSSFFYWPVQNNNPFISFQNLISLLKVLYYFEKILDFRSRINYHKLVCDTNHKSMEEI
jgi:hypothetical protein